MKKKLIIILIGLAIAANMYAQEKESKEASPPTPFPVSKEPFEFTGRQLIVGQGIGELRKEYRLLDNGKIYRRMSTAKEFEVLGDQSKKNIDIAFKSLDDIKFTTINCKHPSRTSYFVRYQKGKQTHEVVWGDPKQPSPESIKRVYKSFMGMIPPSMRL